jgi:hypothetical protein
MSKYGYRLEECDPFELYLQHTPTDVMIGVHADDADDELADWFGVQELIMQVLQGESNGENTVTLSELEEAQWRRSADIFEHIAVAIRIALARVVRPEPGDK